ncbi:MAG: hypothetical protein K9J85_07280 [Desulfobacteraceae bacterium]|nr:hypothetical protein [Desulfobacteraceae bacterium]
MTGADSLAELENFINKWKEDENGCRNVFLELKAHLGRYSDIVLDFVPRPGVTYSLRAARAGQAHRPLFALIDVIDESPRWLSVCFYEGMINDPEELGDLVPEGLMGEDGYCFDVDSNEAALVNYILTRLDEAYERSR